MARSRAWRLVDLAVDAGVSLAGGYRCRRAAFLGHERTLVGDVRAGELAKVVGRLKGAGKPLRAPLTAATCLWYRTVVRRVDVGLFPHVGLLGKTITEEESVELCVDDGTGSALVHMGCARVSLVAMRSGWFEDPPRSVGGDLARAFLGRYAVAAERNQFAASDESQPSIRYREVVLRAGDTVAVLGRPYMEPDPSAGGLGSRTLPIRVVFGGEPGAVIISNEPGVF